MRFVLPMGTDPFFQDSVITTPQPFLFLLPKAPTDFKGEELWPASHSTVSSDMCADLYPHIYSIRDTDSSKITQSWGGDFCKTGTYPLLGLKFPPLTSKA